MSEYKKYLHVERLGSEEYEGLLDNDAVYVTAKVDGSNGCVYWSEKAGGVMVGSRNFELSDAEDNAYFYAWMKSGADEAKLLCAYCAAHPTRIVYGEWMGRDRFIGAFKGYDKAALGKLLIFDVYDTAEECFLGEPEWREELSASGLEPYFIKLLSTRPPHARRRRRHSEGQRFPTRRDGRGRRRRGLQGPRMEEPLWPHSLR